MSPVTAAAGQRRHLVTIKRMVGTISETGGVTEGTPATVGEEYVSIEPISLRDREELQAGGVQAETTHIVRMRYRADVAPAMYLVKGTRRFEILSVANKDEANRELHLLCAERT